MKLVLDHGGPTLLLDETASGAGPRTGLRLRTSVCSSPDCRWVHIDIDSVKEANATETKGTKPGLVTDGPKYSVSVHIDSGAIRAEPPPEEGTQEVEILRRIRELLDRRDGELLEVYRKRWRHAKETTKDDWRTCDWTTLKSGRMGS